MNVPRKAAEAAMPIHKPFSPNNRAKPQQNKGRNKLEEMLHMLGGSVCPIPLKTPEQAPSSAMNTWLVARMRR